MLTEGVLSPLSIITFSSFFTVSVTYTSLALEQSSFILLRTDNPKTVFSKAITSLSKHLSTFFEECFTMAPSKPKREPDATPPPRKGLGIFTDDTVKSAPQASSFAKEATASLIPAAHWRECGEEERLKRVQIKEFAAKNAHFSMRKMLETLITHLPLNPSCQPRIDKISKFKAAVKNSSRIRCD
jgi:hypothetical protein